MLLFMPVLYSPIVLSHPLRCVQRARVCACGKELRNWPGLTRGRVPRVRSCGAMQQQTLRRDAIAATAAQRHSRHCGAAPLASQETVGRRRRREGTHTSSWLWGIRCTLMAPGTCKKVTGESRECQVVSQEARLGGEEAGSLIQGAVLTILPAVLYCTRFLLWMVAAPATVSSASSSVSILVLNLLLASRRCRPGP
jgi:hypothetical protein